MLPSSDRRSRLRRRAAGTALVAAAVAVLAAAGCSTLDILPEALRPPTPWESYRSSLTEAGLDQTVLGRAWTPTASGPARSPTPRRPT